VVDPTRLKRFPQPTGFLDPDDFEIGLAGLTANDGFRDPLTAACVWRDKHGGLGPFGPSQNLHLYPGNGDAFAQAFVLAGHVDAPDLRYLLNITGSSVYGMPKRSDIRAVRAAAIELSYRPAPHRGEGPADPHSRTEWALSHLWFARAGLHPNYIFDVVRGRCVALFPLEQPDFIHGDVQRGRRYDAIVRDIAAAAGGVAAEEPLLTTVPMPGACCVRQDDARASSYVSVTAFLGGADLYGTATPGAHGARIEDLADIAIRLRAAPRFDAAA